MFFGGSTGDRTPDLMTASDKKSRAGITCCYLLLAVVSENGQTGSSVLHGATPCLLLSTSQFTSQLEKIGLYYYQRLYELLPDSRVWHPLKGQCQEDTPLLLQKTYLACMVLPVMNLLLLFCIFDFVVFMSVEVTASHQAPIRIKTSRM